MSPIFRLFVRVNQYYGIELDRLQWAREFEIARIRFAICLVAHERWSNEKRWQHGARSSAWLGLRLGLDHSTVLHGIAKARALEAIRPDYARLVALLREEWAAIYQGGMEL